jgi:hypothetical protein
MAAKSHYDHKHAGNSVSTGNVVRSVTKSRRLMPGMGAPSLGCRHRIIAGRTRPQDAAQTISVSWWSTSFVARLGARVADSSWASLIQASPSFDDGLQPLERMCAWEENLETLTWQHVESGASRFLASLELAASAVGRDDLVRQPDICRQRSGLPEHVDRYSAARRPIAADA